MDLKNIDLKNIKLDDIKEKLKSVDKKTLIKFGSASTGTKYPCLESGSGAPWPE